MHDDIIISVSVNGVIALFPVLPVIAVFSVEDDNLYKLVFFQ